MANIDFRKLGKNIGKTRIRELDKEKMEQEIQDMATGRAENLLRHRNIKYEGKIYDVFEAKTMNKNLNQRGPGDYRILISNGELAGIVNPGRNGYETIYRTN